MAALRRKADTENLDSENLPLPFCANNSRLADTKKAPEGALIVNY